MQPIASPDRMTPPESTAPALSGCGFAIDFLLVRPGRPRYPVFVHRAAALLHASFRPRLATTPLRFANPSPPSGWMKDFHLQTVDHAQHTVNGSRGGPPDDRLREAIQDHARGPGLLRRFARNDGFGNYTIYCPPLIDSVEPVMAPASSEARKTTARAISSGSPKRPIGISGRMDFSSTSFGTACTISVLI
jgi:hypothetical protein